MDNDHCPKCDAKAIVSSGYPRGGFLPKGLRYFEFRWRVGWVSYAAPLRACLACGHVWTHLRPEDLRKLIDKHGTAMIKLKLSAFQKDPPEQDLI